MRKLLMLFLLRLVYRHAHKVIQNVGARGSRVTRAAARRKPAVKRRRAGWEF